jgi:hypothetical protein
MARRKKTVHGYMSALKNKPLECNEMMDPIGQYVCRPNYWSLVDIVSREATLCFSKNDTLLQVL